MKCKYFFFLFACYSVEFFTFCLIFFPLRFKGAGGGDGGGDIITIKFFLLKSVPLLRYQAGKRLLVDKKNTQITKIQTSENMQSAVPAV